MLSDEQVTQIVLERVKKHFGHRISIRDLEIRQHYDYIADEIVLMMKHQMLGTRRTEKKTYAHPDSWWQWFKQDTFPRWLLKKYPVRMKTVIVQETYEKYCTHISSKGRDDDYLRFFLIDHGWVDNQERSLELLTRLRSFIKWTSLRCGSEHVTAEASELDAMIAEYI
jgi:hypothetical protein